MKRVLCALGLAAEACLYALFKAVVFALGVVVLIVAIAAAVSALLLPIAGLAWLLIVLAEEASR